MQTRRASVFLKEKFFEVQPWTQSSWAQSLQPGRPIKLVLNLNGRHCFSTRVCKPDSLGSLQANRGQAVAHAIQEQAATLPAKPNFQEICFFITCHPGLEEVIEAVDQAESTMYGRT